MKLTRTTRREVVLLCLPMAFIGAFAFYFQIWHAPSDRLVGTWKATHSEGTVLMTFKANGEWEEVFTYATTGEVLTADGSGVGTPLVIKGRYSESRNTFRTFDRKRYTRRGGRDILFTPCTDSIGCATQHEIISIDEELSKPKYFSKIVEADWERGILKVRSTDFGQYKGTITTWTRQ